MFSVCDGPLPSVWETNVLYTNKGKDVDACQSIAKEKINCNGCKTGLRNPSFMTLSSDLEN